MGSILPVGLKLMKKQTIAVVQRTYWVPFAVITMLFAMWGFANDITNPLVAAFRTIMEISNFEAAWVQLAFYGGYGTMAIPAALFIRRFSYKSGIMMGLILYAVGALLFYPAARFEMFGFFLLSLYILTFGLAFLETTANPFILSMGDEETATRRLNFAQSFNPMGSLTGMFVATNFILSALHSEERNEAGELIFSTLSEAEKAVIRSHDLMVIRNPYVILGFVVLIMFVVVALMKMPKTQTLHSREVPVSESARRLFKNRRYMFGVVAQVFYVGVQIMCWTFIIHYAESIGLTKAQGQNYNIVAMILFLSSRFLSTWFMKYFRATLMLALFAVGGMVTTLGVIFIGGTTGLYLLVATSGFMSLMFPTIYGIALQGLKEDSTLGAAGLVMAIVGGALMPPLQARIIDLGWVGSLPAVNFSFILPLLCFVVIALYGIYSYRDGRNSDMPEAVRARA